MASHFDNLTDEECVEYSAQCLAEGIPIPEAIVERLKEMGVYNLIMESARGT